MPVWLGTCCRAELWLSASDYCMLAFNQWPLQRWYYWTYTYSFSALNQCVKAPRRAEALQPHWERLNKEIEAIGPDVCLLGKLQIRHISRYEKYTIKQFEISIVITSYLLSLPSRVTLHTRKSRGSLRRERIGLSSVSDSEMNTHYFTVTAIADCCIHGDCSPFIQQRYCNNCCEQLTSIFMINRYVILTIKCQKILKNVFFCQTNSPKVQTFSVYSRKTQTSIILIFKSLYFAFFV